MKILMVFILMGIGTLSVAQGIYSQQQNSGSVYSSPQVPSYVTPLPTNPTPGIMGNSGVNPNQPWTTAFPNESPANASTNYNPSGTVNNPMNTNNPFYNSYNTNTTTNNASSTNTGGSLNNYGSADVNTPANTVSPNINVGNSNPGQGINNNGMVNPGSNSGILNGSQYGTSPLGFPVYPGQR